MTIFEQIKDLLTKEVVEFVVTVSTLFVPFLFKRIRVPALEFAKKVFTNKPHDDAISGKELNNKIIHINNRLLELLLVLKADRAYVFQFHNGSVFSNQQPIWKISCTHEVCARGISYEGQRIQSLLASSVWEYICAIFNLEGNLFQHGYTRVYHPTCGSSGHECRDIKGTYVYIVDQMPESYTKYLLQDQNIRIMIHSPLLDTKNNIVGIIGVDFNSDNFDLNEKLSHSCEVCRASTEISFILNGVGK